MEIRNCKCCDRAFGYNGGPVILCSKCDELLWGKVKDYLKEHPNATAEEVNKETRVKLDIIDGFLADDRLKSKDVVNNSPASIQSSFSKCQSCGTPISLGNTYCSVCMEKQKKAKILNEINNMYKEEQRPNINIEVNNSSRMFISTERIRKRR